jgi:hypothetical protein
MLVYYITIQIWLGLKTFTDAGIDKKGPNTVSIVIHVLFHSFEKSISETMRVITQN